MSIRLPLRAVLSATNHGEDGTNSVSGGIAHTFILPQDIDSVVVKLQASTVAGAVSAVFQTSDDGGTTWFDVGRTSIVSNSSVNALAEWMTIPVAGFGYRSQSIGSTVATGSIIGVGSVMTTTGSSGASTLAQKQLSGLPIMSQNARIFIR